MVFMKTKLRYLGVRTYVWIVVGYALPRKLFLHHLNNYCPGKTTTITCIALREGLASFGIVEVQLRDPLKPLEHHSMIALVDLRGAIHWSSIMPKDVSLSDSRTSFLQPGIITQEGVSIRGGGKNCVLCLSFENFYNIRDFFFLYSWLKFLIIKKYKKWMISYCHRLDNII